MKLTTLRTLNEAIDTLLWCAAIANLLAGCYWGLLRDDYSKGTFFILFGVWLKIRDFAK